MAGDKTTDPEWNTTNEKTTTRKRKADKSDNRNRNITPEVKQAIETTNKFEVLQPDNDSENEEESWECTTCKVTFKDSNAMMMECERCDSHYCIECLNKDKEE